MASNERFIEVYPDKEALSLAAVERVIYEANISISEKGFFTIALAGGSTPKRLYELLASSDYRDKTDWSKWHIFIGDERLVPFSSPDSNFGMAKSILVDNVAILEENIHPIDTVLGNMAAVDYEKKLKALYDRLGISGLDVILLGLGSDGHTLSLFPGKQAVTEKVSFVVATEHGILPPLVDRISITRATVEAAKLALFLVAGEDKSIVVEQIVHNSPSVTRPASLIAPTDTLSVCWMLDQAAASRLK